MNASHDNLPPQPTPFIGRVAELDVLATLLADPSCRLMTVLGAGGIGKTRVALELACRLRSGHLAHGSTFIDGVWFVALQDIRSSTYLVSTIADTLRCPLSGVEDPHDQLIGWLRDKQVLLLLDTFEQLTSEADLLPAILAAAPDVKLLVTSREALNLQEEWRYPLSGLELPEADDSDDLDQSSAVRLFVERARRVRHDFDLVAEQDAVVRICRLVEGMPLAIELAAAWTRTLSCAAIAREMKGNIQFLAGAWHNVPARHRSMRAAFDHSWKLLDADERNVLMGLSVFRGGFAREAAAQITGATLLILTALVDKSLLRGLPSIGLEDRFHLHDLLRQYAEEQLEQSPAEAARVRDAHCAYYTGFLQQRTENVNGRRQREALAEIAADLENVRTAWEHALEHTRVTEIQRAAYTFYLFLDYQSRYREGADLFERATRALSATELTVEVGPVLAEILVCLGWLNIRLGRLQQSKAVLERSQAILRRLNVAPRPGPGTDPLVALGTLACTLGAYAEAARLGEEARRLNDARGDQGNLMYAYYVLTNAASAQGHYDAARQYAHQAYALADRLHDRWFMAYIVSDLGHVATALGDLADASQQYQASFTIREEFGDPEGMAVALTHLGEIALLQADYPEAHALFQRSLAIYREIADPGGLAAVMHGLGMVACATGEHVAAGKHLHEAFQITAAMGYTMRTLAILTGIAEWLLLIGQPERAAKLLVVILHHPATDRETGDRTRKLLHWCETELAPDAFAAATQYVQTADLDSVLACLGIASGMVGSGSSVDHIPASAHAPLDERLTEREIEVLRLIADGQSNQQIAERLIISLGTAKWYASQIFGKLNVHSRTQAVMQARARGIIP